MECDFSKIPISNMVGIFTLNNKLDMNAIFRLCTLNGIGDIKHISFQLYSRGVKKCKKCTKKKDNKRCWKNGLVIKMCNNLSVKLSDNVFHITGLKSRAQAENCLNLFNLNLIDVESTVNYINQNIEKAQECVEWIKDATKGREVYVIKNSGIEANANDVVIYNEKMYLKITSDLYQKLNQHKHLIPKDSSPFQLVYENGGVYELYQLIEIERFTTIIREVQVPAELDPKIITFLLDKMVDFAKYEEYRLNLDWFLTIKSLYKDEGMGLNSLNFKFGNINYNHNLGFEVDLNSIHTAFNNIESDFVCEYFKDISKYAIVTAIMDLPEDLQPEMRKGIKAKLPKFVIYTTGAVTQSGPHPTLNGIAHKNFMKIANLNVNKIKKKKD